MVWEKHLAMLQILDLLLPGGGLLLVGWGKIPKGHCMWLQFWEHLSTFDNEIQELKVECEKGPGSKSLEQIECVDQG